MVIMACILCCVNVKMHYRCTTIPTRSRQTYNMVWKMAFHSEKCNVLPVTRTNNPIKFNYNLQDRPLESLEEAKYLSLILRQYLTWKNYVSNICVKANKILGFLRRNLGII